MTRRRARTVVIAAVGILLLIAVGLAQRGVSGDDSGLEMIAAEDESGGAQGSTAAGSGATAMRDVRAPADRYFSDDTMERASATSGLAAGGSASSGGGSSMGFAATDGDGSADGGASADAGADLNASTIPLPPLSDSERIIKDGRIEVEVPKGRFDEAFRGVLSLATKAGGQVASSQSSRDDKRASGEITIRVPAQRFDQLLESTSGIGKIEHREVSSQDVSGEFVDLQARVRHLQAQEQFYLGLLGKARVVGDAIAINQHLSGVQAEMERIQGRLRLLDEQTTYSRLTISLYEPGVAPLLSDRVIEHPGALGQAWDEAMLAFQETIGALLVGTFTMAPLLALGLLAWALWRRLRPRPAAQDPQPVAQEEKGPLPVG